jgi:hypothetical protein
VTVGLSPTDFLDVAMSKMERLIPGFEPVPSSPLLSYHISPSVRSAPIIVVCSDSSMGLSNPGVV